MSEPSLDELDYYALLGVPRTVDGLELKRAFREFARRYHPDNFTNDPAEVRDRATAIYRRGSEGYSVLSDNESRLRYDRGLRGGKMRLLADEQKRAQTSAAPRAPSAISSPQAQALYKEAMAAAKAGDYQAAYTAVAQALSFEPESELLQRQRERLETVLKPS